MSRFTVLGGHGQIGRKLVAYLDLQGHDVSVLVRDESHIFDRHLGHVIYAIGVTADFRSRPFETMDAHVNFLGQVLMRASFESFLYLSSTRVYCGTDLANENSPLQVRPQDPSDLYNLSKLAGESLCLHCGCPGVRVARLSNVVGADNADSPNFLPSLVREAKQGIIRLQSDPLSAKDYIHIADVVRLLERIALQGTQSLYNLASGQQISHAEWVEVVRSIHPCKLEVLNGAPCQRCPPISIRRIQDEFNFKPKKTLNQASLIHL